jgi:hypothetical protein
MALRALRLPVCTIGGRKVLDKGWLMRTCGEDRIDTPKAPPTLLVISAADQT